MAEEGPMAVVPTEADVKQVVEGAAVLHQAMEGTLPPDFSARGVLYRVCLSNGLLAVPSSTDATLDDTLSRWASALVGIREAYFKDKEELTAPPGDDDDDPLANNPLSFGEDSAWAEYHRNRQLLDDIEKDTTRLYPDGLGDFFQDAALQALLSSVLFVWCRKNPDLSYRQGMHELAAALLWTLLGEDVTGLTGHMSTLTSRDGMEADCYLLFSGVMDGLGELFGANDVREEVLPLETPADVVAEHALDAAAAPDSPMPPVLKLCTRILHLRLRQACPAVHRNLVQLGIEPQLFCLRWTRLLFSREFLYRRLYRLWDAVFASHMLAMTASLRSPETIAWALMESVEWVATAMLVHLRSKLIEDDYTTALTTLMSSLSDVDDAHVVFALAMELRRNGGKLATPPTPELAPAPAPPTLPVASEVRDGVAYVEADTVPQLLRAFYERTNPSKVPTVSTILEKYKGHENLLMQHLWKRYHDSPVGDPSHTVIKPCAAPPRLASPPQASSTPASPGRVLGGLGSMLSNARQAIRTAVRPPPARHVTSSSVAEPAVVHPVLPGQQHHLIGTQHPNARLLQSPIRTTPARSTSRAPVPGELPAPLPVRMGHRMEGILEAMEAEVSKLLAVGASKGSPMAEDPLVEEGGGERSGGGDASDDGSTVNANTLGKCLSDLKVVRDVLLGRLNDI